MRYLDRNSVKTSIISRLFGLESNSIKLTPIDDDNDDAIIVGSSFDPQTALSLTADDYTITGDVEVTKKKSVVQRMRAELDAISITVIEWFYTSIHIRLGDF